MLEAHLRDTMTDTIGWGYPHTRAPALAIMTDGADTTNTNALPVNGRRGKVVNRRGKVVTAAGVIPGINGVATGDPQLAHPTWRIHENLSYRALFVACPIRTDGRGVCDVTCA